MDYRRFSSFTLFRWSNLSGFTFCYFWYEWYNGKSEYELSDLHSYILFNINMQFAKQPIDGATLLIPMHKGSNHENMAIEKIMVQMDFRYSSRQYHHKILSSKLNKINFIHKQNSFTFHSFMLSFREKLFVMHIPEKALKQTHANKL